MGFGGIAIGNGGLDWGNVGHGSFPGREVFVVFNVLGGNHQVTLPMVVNLYRGVEEK